MNIFIMIVSTHSASYVKKERNVLIIGGGDCMTLRSNDMVKCYNVRIR